MSFDENMKIVREEVDKLKEKEAKLERFKEALEVKDKEVQAMEPDYYLGMSEESCAKEEGLVEGRKEGFEMLKDLIGEYLDIYI